MTAWRRIAYAIAAAAFLLSFVGTLAGVIPPHDRGSYGEIR